jgi:hypothetical protein
MFLIWMNNPGYGIITLFATKLEWKSGSGERGGAGGKAF